MILSQPDELQGLLANVVILCFCKAMEKQKNVLGIEADLSGRHQGSFGRAEATDGCVEWGQSL